MIRMHSSFGVALLALAVTALCACGDDDNGGDDQQPIDAAATVDSTTPIDAKLIDGNTPIDANIDSSPGGTQLTVKNYLSWCSVTVDGHAASTSGSQVVTVTPGAINVSARAASAAFILGEGMWHHTDGDTGSGEDGTVTDGSSAAVVTVGADATCIWVCCPFTNGTGCDNLPDQCQ